MSDYNYDNDFEQTKDYGSFFDDDDDDFADSYDPIDYGDSDNNSYYDDDEDFENEYDDYDDYDAVTKPVRRNNRKGLKNVIKRFFSNDRIFFIPLNRKGIKWQFLELYNKLHIRILLLILAFLFLVFIILSIGSCGKTSAKQADTSTTAASAIETTADTYGHKITTVPVISQDELHAACETYACVMLLQSYGFDIDEYEFVDTYLITKDFHYENGQLYGPDMDAAYAGDVYTGYGINAPAMAKCMNNFISTTDSKLSAKPLKGVALEDLCSKYIDKDIPVMVWETTYMQEPYVKETWLIDYTDENSTRSYGDTESWQQNEHCMVLVGYDRDNYYFCDSVAGKLASYDRKTSEERYEQIGSQAIILE